VLVRIDHDRADNDEQQCQGSTFPFLCHDGHEEEQETETDPIGKERFHEQMNESIITHVLEKRLALFEELKEMRNHRSSG
jgi:hypothetical protein